MHDMFGNYMLGPSAHTSAPVPPAQGPELHSTARNYLATELAVRAL